MRVNVVFLSRALKLFHDSHRACVSEVTGTEWQTIRGLLDTVGVVLGRYWLVYRRLWQGMGLTQML